MRMPLGGGERVTIYGIIAISVLLIALSAPVWAGYEKTESGRGTSVLSGQRIASVQRDLSSLGYPAGPADGVIGQKTRTAVRQFEAKMHMPITGKITKKLELAIRAAKRSKAQKLSYLKACRRAVEAKTWAVAVRTCPQVAEAGAAGHSELSRGIAWLRDGMCESFSLACQ